MKNIKNIILIIIAVFSLGACARLGINNGANIDNAPDFSSVGVGLQVQPEIASANLANNISSYIGREIAEKLSKKELAEAASAQYYALQFGRVGAPRVWQGDRGASGKVFVGPYVRVNSLNCRQFTHSIIIEGQKYEQKGTACRENSGNWYVANIR